MEPLNRSNTLFFDKKTKNIYQSYAVNKKTGIRYLNCAVSTCKAKVKLHLESRNAHLFGKKHTCTLYQSLNLKNTRKFEFLLDESSINPNLMQLKPLEIYKECLNSFENITFEPGFQTKCLRRIRQKRFKMNNNKALETVQGVKGIETPNRSDNNTDDQNPNDQFYDTDVQNQNNDDNQGEIVSNVEHRNADENNQNDIEPPIENDNVIPLNEQIDIVAAQNENTNNNIQNEIELNTEADNQNIQNGCIIDGSEAIGTNNGEMLFDLPLSVLLSVYELDASTSDESKNYSQPEDFFYISKWYFNKKKNYRPTNIKPISILYSKNKSFKTKNEMSSLLNHSEMLLNQILLVLKHIVIMIIILMMQMQVK